MDRDDRAEHEVSDEEPDEDDPEESESSDEEDEESEEESSYYSDEDEESADVKPPIPEAVGADDNMYTVGTMLGSGSYSEVYAGSHCKTGEQVAVKIEWQKAEKTGKLLEEAQFYVTLGRCRDVPRVRWVGVQGEYNIMVMDVLGVSLDDLFKKLQKFSLKTTLLVAEQVIDRLEYVHKCGILYRDIKPHNFLFGREDKVHMLHLVDFGLAKSFLDKKKQHVPCVRKKRTGVTGTVRYSSINVHLGYDAGRRDDLEAAGYMFLHFLRGNLPWLGMSATSKKTKHQVIGDKKMATSDEALCAGFPREFVEYFSYCRSLKFEDKPDYNKLREMLRSCFHKHGFAKDYQYDWSNGVANGRSRGDAKLDGPSPRRSRSARRGG
eukprot:TRINITY_DN102462_c0_g1_i1.p1 TRINITY_DN102462_c0_g1~~TRINITY_DN102462_c0_g1_i1.p1  ORF type:complete len:379 (-),score=94.67 TRINITY_DN102462_c0_g1_i1:277-1413(-)